MVGAAVAASVAGGGSAGVLQAASVRVTKINKMVKLRFMFMVFFLFIWVE
jgi:hypothetical protein